MICTNLCIPIQLEFSYTLVRMLLNIRLGCLLRTLRFCSVVLITGFLQYKYLWFFVVHARCVLRFQNAPLWKEYMKQTGYLILLLAWVTDAGVIEPSFGIGRIIYCLYEHSYYTRDGDEQRSVFKFTPVAAPVKATVFPLLQKPEFEPYTQRVGDVLTRAGVARKVRAAQGRGQQVLAH